MRYHFYFIFMLPIGIHWSNEVSNQLTFCIETNVQNFLFQLEHGSGGGSPLSPTMRRSIEEPSCLWRRKAGLSGLYGGRQASMDELRRRRESFAGFSPHYQSMGSIYHSGKLDSLNFLDYLYFKPMAPLKRMELSTRIR